MWGHLQYLGLCAFADQPFSQRSSALSFINENSSYCVVKGLKKAGKPKNLVLRYKVFSDAQTGGNADIFFILPNLHYVVPEWQIYIKANKKLDFLCCLIDLTHHLVIYIKCMRFLLDMNPL